MVFFFLIVVYLPSINVTFKLRSLMRRCLKVVQRSGFTEPAAYGLYNCKTFDGRDAFPNSFLVIW